MKKLLALILAVICCLGMVACGGEDNSKTLDDAISLLNSLYKDTTITPVDYEVVGSVKVGDKTVNVTWTVSNSAIKVVKNGQMVTIDLPEENETETTYVLKATVKLGKQSKSKDFIITLPIIVLNVFETEPAENTAFKLMLTQVTLGKNLFATHETQNGNKGPKYIKSTEDAAAAPDFFAEKVEGGYKIYTMIEGAKKYVTASLPTEDGKDTPSKYLGYSDEGTVWYYKADCKAWFTMIDGGEYVLGTYSSFDTICISDGSYMKPDTTGVTQFPANLITPENVSKLSPVEKPEGPELPEADSVLTIAQILELAADMTHNVYSEGKYYVVGEITEVYNEQYGNMYIKDAEGNTLTIYGTYSADGETRYDAMATKPVAGDTVKIYGVIGQYNGTAQVKNGWIVEHTVATGTGNSGNTGNTDNSGNSGNTNTEGNQNVGTPATSLEIGKAYIITANNADGKLYVTGGVTSGRFDAATGVNDAAKFFVEAGAESGDYLLYFMNSGAKTYIIMEDKAAGGKTTANSAEATVFAWNAELNTLVVKDPENARAFGAQDTSTYSNLSAYAVSNTTGYNWGQFLPIEG